MIDDLCVSPKIADGLAGVLMRGWPLDKACQVLEATICKIARDHPEQVNTNVRVATISKEHGRTYSFGKPSPINRQVYPFKTVHVIFADEPGEIVIVTVLVYYGDRRMDDEDSL
jgi:hypothetical protein